MMLDPHRTALVLIDLQKAIVGRELRPRSGNDVLSAAIKLARRFREVGAPVVQVHVGWSQDRGDALQQPVDRPMPRPSNDAADFSEFAEGLVQPTDIIIKKRQWGAFYGTELDLQLRRRDISTLILGGIATNFGVESTARAAWEHGYHIIFAEDATSSMSAEMHAFPYCEIFPRLGNISSTDAILGMLPAKAA